MGDLPTWKHGQILYRLHWMPHRATHNQTIRVTEYVVVKPTPKGGWIEEHDVYVGEKPDRSKGNLRPMLKEGRQWRSASGNFAHPTMEAARYSLGRRTQRHLKILNADVAKVRARMYELGLDAKACDYNPFRALRRYDA